MVMAKISSKDYSWYPEAVEGDDPKVFNPTYRIVPSPEPEVGFFRSRFADLPAFGIWKDRTETDEELLEELGSGWRGFAAE
jgi:hypothetical protein